MGSWLITECMKKYLQHRRDYNKRNKDKENYDDADDDDNNQLPAQKKRKEKKNSMNYMVNFHEKKGNEFINQLIFIIIFLLYIFFR